ncbi:MAG: hypothetical protein NTW14_13705 [bacterium]|nr:hypothetical protein [bacterium]
MPDKMYVWLEDFPRQIKHAAELGQSWDLFTVERPKGLAFLGIGGSAIGATIVCNLYRSVLSTPVVVSRGDEPPAWLKEGTLAAAISYSGETKETLTAFQRALKMGAAGAALTTGGSLLQTASAQHIPKVQIPAGYAPRAALGYTSIPLIYLLEKLGIIPRDTIQIEPLVKLLESVRYEWSDNTGPGAGVARRLLKRLPLIVGGGLMSAVAQRFQAQLAENAKVISIMVDVPEALHNLVETLDPISIEQFNPIAVYLEDPKANDEIKAQMRKIRAAMSDAGIEGIPILAQGDADVARLYSLIYKLDWISYHLAKLRGVDPTTIPIIMALKEK